MHRSHWAKRLPKAPYHDYFHGDHIENQDLDGHNVFQSGRILSSVKNGAITADYLTRAATWTCPALWSGSFRATSR